jgi:hypothetical protein
LYLSEPGNQRVEAFWRWLSAALGEDVPFPLAMPDAEVGSAQLAWDTERYHLDVSIPRDGDEEWFFMDRQTDECRDGVLPADAVALLDALRLVVAELKHQCAP